MRYNIQKTAVFNRTVTIILTNKGKTAYEEYERHKADAASADFIRTVQVQVDYLLHYNGAYIFACTFRLSAYLADGRFECRQCSCLYKMY